MKRWVWLVAVACVFPIGVALAAVPDNAGVIHACYGNAGGAVRIVDTGGPTPNCDQAGETALTWNQTGPSGPAGPTGPAGPDGGGVTVYTRRWGPSRIINAAGLDYADYSEAALKLPAGDYVVRARAYRSAGTTTLYGCRLAEGAGLPREVDLYHGSFNDSTIDSVAAGFVGGDVPRELAGTLHLDASGYVAFQCVPYGVTVTSNGGQIHKRLSLRTGKDGIWVTITAIAVAKLVEYYDAGEPAPVTPAPPETVKAFRGRPLSGHDTAALASAASGGAKLTRAGRARIVLLASAGLPAVQISALTSASPAQVSNTLKAYQRRGVRGLR
jgi:hypothetical protein